MISIDIAIVVVIEERSFGEELRCCRAPLNVFVFSILLAAERTLDQEVPRPKYYMYSSAIRPASGAAGCMARRGLAWPAVETPYENVR